ncbi:MAG: DNA-directed RNA polymerase subunit omega [Clostridia bacterium]|nr:DNA-directed RNA polymerase subunit omega [Clostridia bacterium]
MADSKMTEPEISELLKIEGIDSRFTLCSIVSKRARQLEDELYYAERDCKDVPNKKLNLEHGKAVSESVYELLEGKLTFKKVEEA